MSKSALSYHLAEALLSMIYTSNGSLYQRTNLIAIILSDVEAMIGEKAVGDIKGNMQLLRESYEPIMDHDVTVMTKKMAYEQILDQVRTDLLVVIDTKNLVSQGNLETVKATKWGKSKEEDNG